MGLLVTATLWLEKAMKLYCRGATPTCAWVLHSVNDSGTTTYFWWASRDASRDTCVTGAADAGLPPESVVGWIAGLGVPIYPFVLPSTGGMGGVSVC